MTEKVKAALDSLSELKEASEEQEGAGFAGGDGGLGPKRHTDAGAESSGTLPSGEFEGPKARLSGAHPSKLKIVFNEKLGREPQRNGMVRYQPNPTPNWGPMNKARGDG